MANYATVDDLTRLWRTMTAEEQNRATALLTIVSSELRIRADAVGKDLDALVADNTDLAEVAKSVTCDVVARMLMTSTTNEPVSQYSESAGGISVSGTYLVPGGGVFIKRSELARLGLRRQSWGAVEVF